MHPITFTKPQVRFTWRYLFLFILLSLIAWGLVMTGIILFPNQRVEVHLGRIAFAIGGVMLLILGSKWLLRKNEMNTAALGLKVNLPHLMHFLLGLAGGVLLIFLLTGVFYRLIPFSWIRGSLSVSDVLLAAHGYFWGNFTEELVFRGYALIFLLQVWGTRKALWILALLFGLFHLPGMGLGIEALKMIATTLVSSFIFSYAFLLTGTLWTAIGVHVSMNILLHTVLGLDGEGKPSLWKPVFEASVPTHGDLGFWTYLIITGSIALGLSIVYSKSHRKHINFLRVVEEEQ